jgi:hypothetical protein
MAARYFTVEEANELLPEIEPLVGKLLQRRARVVEARKNLDNVIEDLRSDIGGMTATELVAEFEAIEYLVKKIQSYGCIVKDMNTGLLDFLAERNGREVYLCWRYGEPRIAYYHEIHTGYNGRQPV